MKKLSLIVFILLISSNLYCINVVTELDTVNTDMSQTNIGDRVFFNILIEHKETEIVNFIGGVKSETFVLLSYNKKVTEKENNAVSNFEFESAFFDTGIQTIPSLEFQIVDDSDTSYVYSDSLTVDVKTILVGDSTELKDIQPPLSLNLTFFDWLLPILIIVVIIFLIFLFIRIKSKKPIFAEQKKKGIPAHIIALDKLKNLRLQDFLTKGKIKKYYVEISWICREYLENRFKLPILELTSSEIKQIFKKYNIGQNSKFNPNMYKILTNCDKVKYAKFIPPLSEAENTMNDLVNLINDTKLVEENENRIS